VAATVEVHVVERERDDSDKCSVARGETRQWPEGAQRGCRASRVGGGWLEQQHRERERGNADNTRKKKRGSRILNPN